MNLWKEALRRNVIKVGIAYLALAWLVIQITDSAVPALNLPESLNGVVFYLGLIGFPFALFFAWAFELTPDGLRRSEDVEANQSVAATTGNKLEHAIVALLASAVLFMVWDNYIYEPNVETPTPEANQQTAAEQTAPTSEQTIPTASVAVLPFIDMSPNKDHDYFSDGISEEILNVLAKIPELHVTSRSSAFSYKGKEIHIPTVAKELGVASILEGSVRKYGTKVRITAQLIQAEGDKHLWSETYDRELDDIFAIQDEISIAIVEQLREHLGLEENITVTTNQGLSDNTEAYEAYLRGHQLILQRTNESINTALNNLEYALQLDPDFALAHAELAIAHVLLVDGQYGDLPFEEASALAKPHADRAYTLAPDLPEALAAKGFVMWNIGVSPEIVSYMEEAIKRSPNHSTITLWLSLVYEEMGEYKKSLALKEKLMRLDPLNLNNLSNIVSTYLDVGRFEDADKIVKKLALFNLTSYHRSYADIQFDQGDLAGAANSYLSALSLEPKQGLIRALSANALLNIGLQDGALSISQNFSPDLWASAERYDEVISELSKESGPLLTEKKRWLARALASKGRYQEALPIYEEVWDTIGRHVVDYGGFNETDAAIFIAVRRALNPKAEIDEIRSSMLNNLGKMEAAGYIPKRIAEKKALIAWVDGAYEDMLGHLKAAKEYSFILRQRNAAYLSELLSTPSYADYLKGYDHKVELQQASFITGLCKDNPFSDVWSPSQESCVVSAD